jgi:iron complex transport system permease protein
MISIHKKQLHKKQSAVKVIFNSAVLLVLLFFISLLIGRYHVTPEDVFKVFYSKLFKTDCNVSEMVQSVIIKVRIPRIFAAVLIGGALSAAGAVYQGLFKNPMVSPDILGASAGAGFGAAIAILLSLPFVFIQFSAFIFGILAVGLAYFICKTVSRGKDALLILVLAGMIVSTLFSSLITLSKYIADPYSKLPEITYWLMGGLSAVSKNDVLMLIIPFICGIIPLFLLRWQLNAMAFGDEEAKSMGLNTGKLRKIYIVSATLLTAASVAVCGMIGWIGLVIPHLTRMLVGPNYKFLMPASFLIGGIFLLIVDNLARAIFTVEIPLGILTSIIGAPFFVYLLIKRKKGWV